MGFVVLIKLQSYGDSLTGPSSAHRNRFVWDSEVMPGPQWTLSVQTYV